MNKSDPAAQLLLAGVLLTRLPLPRLAPAQFAQGPRAVWAYPVIGAGVGLAGVAAGQLALVLGLPDVAAGVACLAAMIVLTGAMHEDGLADVCDGFWGGFDPARRLEIMRDSQIGTYGVLALGIILALRLTAVAGLLTAGWATILVAAALSRALMPAVMAGLPPARRDGLSHSVGRPAWPAAAGALAIGGAITLICLGSAAVPVLLLAAAAGAGVAAVARRKIGGQTGDVLGAVQQLAEVAILLGCLALM